MGFEEVLRSITLSIARGVTFGSQTLLFGIPVVLLLVVRPSFAGLAPDVWERGRLRVSTRIEGLVQACLVGAFIGTGVAILLQAALVADAGDGNVDLGAFSAAIGSRFGQMHVLRLPLLVGLAILLVGRIRRWALRGAGDGARAPGRVWWGGWLVLSALLLSTSTLSGHAAVASPLWLSVANDCLHLACAGAWFAGIVILAVVLPDASRGNKEAKRIHLLAPSVARFSTVALVTFTLLGVTGVLNSFLHVGRLSDLTQTSYGQAVLAKMGLYLAILALGALNHFVVKRRLQEAVAKDDDSAASVFRMTIALELTLALMVVALTGLLTGLARTRSNELPQRSGGGAEAQDQAPGYP